LISGSEDATIRIWDITDIMPKIEPMTGANRKRTKANTKQNRSPCRRILYGHISAVKCVDYHNDVIISGDIRGQIRIWHFSTYETNNLVVIA
jgi:WD40 repeat protein